MATRATTVQITMPQMGESVTEGTVLEWLKQVGDAWRPTSRWWRCPPTRSTPRCRPPPPARSSKILAEPDATVQVGAVARRDRGGRQRRRARTEADARTRRRGCRGRPSTPRARSADAELVDVAFPEMGDSVAEGTVLEWRVAVGRHRRRRRPAGRDLDRQGRRRACPRRSPARSPRSWSSRTTTVAVGTVLCRIAAGAGAAPAQRRRPQPEAPTRRRAPLRPATAPPTPRPWPRAWRAPTASTSTRSPAPARAGGSPRRTCWPRSRATAPPRPPPAPDGVETSRSAARPPRSRASWTRAARSPPPPASAPCRWTCSTPAARELKDARPASSRFTHLIAWAIVQAARDMPVMGNSYAEQDGKPQRVVPAAISLGLAVDVERKDGTRSLVVPVLDDASELGFADFVARYDELVAGARDNTLPPDAYSGRQHHAHQPRRHRHRGQRAAADARARARSSPPARSATRPASPRSTPERAEGAGRPEGHDDDLAPTTTA